MKIASFGDIHLGTSCDPDVRVAAHHITNKCYMENVDLIVMTGDIYDSTSDPDSRELAKSIVTEAANVCPVVIIKGNHDAKKDLLILGDLKAKFPIDVYENPASISYPLQGEENLIIHYLPWFTKAAWVAGNVGVNMGIDAGNEAVSLLALKFLQAQIAKAGPGKHLLYAHLMISGSRAENHQPLLGEGITFGYHDLVEAGLSGGAFGHIHLAQTFGDPATGPEFRYNGAIAALNYGESALDKGFSILDTDTMKVEVIQVPSIKRLTFDTEWNGAMSFGAILPDPTCEGARVRVRMQVAEGYDAEDGRKMLREYFGDLKPLELKIETQSKPRDLVRAQEISQAKDACDKLVAYWNATGTRPQPPMDEDMLALTREVEAECLITKETEK